MLVGFYQNLFLGREVLPNPSYKKLRLSERSFNKVHYNDIYILEPLHYYYVDLNENISEYESIKAERAFFENGLFININKQQNKIYIFNASQNIIYLQKGANIGEAFLYGWKFTNIKNFKWYCRNNI